jgi:hypothetical protein
MAQLMQVRKGRMVSLGAIPPALVGKVTMPDQLKAASVAATRHLEAEARKARREQEAESGTEIPAELQALAGDALAAKYESVFARKPGNRTEETQRLELAGHEAEGTPAGDEAKAAE